MMIAQQISRKIGLAGDAMLAAISLCWLAGCSTGKAELRQEIEVLLQQTMSDVRQETQRVDHEIAQLRSEVAQLQSSVGDAHDKVGRLGSDVEQLNSDVSLLQVDVHKNDTSLVNLATHVNQLDRRVARTDRLGSSDGGTSGKPGPSADRSGATQAPADPLTTAARDASKALKQGMSQQEVLALFGEPQGQERILDSVYWYYADGDLKGQYVRFDATTGHVNGWSSFAPQHFQIDLRTIRGKSQP